MVIACDLAWPGEGRGEQRLIAHATAAAVLQECLFMDRQSQIFVDESQSAHSARTRRVLR